MKTVYKPLIVGASVLLSLNAAQGQNDSIKKELPFSFEASYIGDVVRNFSGGIKKGTTYLGLANLKAGFDTEAANWWKGGSFFVNVGNTHGGEPSATLVGDFLGVSNIEAGNLTFMYELWYKQNFGRLDITLGLQDLNADFAASENGALFTNSSFGIHSNIADNVTTAIFPLTALGANVQWNISDAFLWQAAIFDGTPDDFATNPYNTDWKLSKNQGFLAITEFQINKSLLKGKTGSYKFGVYYHEHNDTIEVQQRNGGFYFVGDQQITNKLSAFSQIGLSPRKTNLNNCYLSVGLNYTGFLGKRPNDQLGVAVAYAGFNNAAIGSEMAIELTYKFEINKNIYLKPDIQYIINPAGTDAKLNDALVGFIRFGIDF